MQLTSIEICAFIGKTCIYNMPIICPTMQYFAVLEHAKLPLKTYKHSHFYVMKSRENYRWIK